jgi:hypothetical protein
VTLSSLIESIYPRNPRYGSGIFRRRVRLSLEPERATGVVNDNYHAMWLRLAHDGTTIRDVDAGMQRWPKTTCPGAIHVVREIIGVPLSASRRAFYANGRAGRNCTHLLDVAFWAIRQVQRGPSEPWVRPWSISRSRTACAEKRGCALRSTAAPSTIGS